VVGPHRAVTRLPLMSYSAHTLQVPRRPRRLPEPREVLAGRARASIEVLFALVHEVNPTDLHLDPEEEALRYAEKSALQSLLIARHGDALSVEEVSEDLVSLRHRHGMADACHAVVSTLDDAARRWVRGRLVEAGLDEPEAIEPVETSSIPAVRPPLARGRAALDEWDYDGARACFEEALRTRPSEEAAFALLDLLVNHLGLDRAALEHPLPARVSSTRVRKLRALAAARLGERDQVRRLLTELPRSDTGEVLVALARQALRTGDLDEAEAHLRALRQVDPANGVLLRIGEELDSMTRGAASEDFVRVVQTIFDLKQEGNLADANALLSWLSGSSHVAAKVKKLASVKGDIGSSDALSYLRGILEIVKAAGYKGLVIVIDEAETILRTRSDVRAKSLNGIRQIVDASQDYLGLLWIFTGTPEFFDTRRGVAGLPPLHDRIRFLQEGGYSSLRQAQLELRPFDKETLRDVAFRLRELYPAQDRERIDAMVHAEFIGLLVDKVTEGFKGDVGVVPRQFLRVLVHHLDAVDEDEEYEPMYRAGFVPEQMSPEEESAMSGKPAEDHEGDEEELIPVEDAW